MEYFHEKINGCEAQIVVKFGELRSKLFPQLDYQDKLSRGFPYKLVSLSYIK